MGVLQRSLFLLQNRYPEGATGDTLIVGTVQPLVTLGPETLKDVLASHWEEGHAQRMGRNDQREKRAVCQLRIWPDGLFCLSYQAHLSLVPRPWAEPTIT